MPFQPVTPQKLSHAVVRQIELLILRGILRPGERLPPERALSEKLGVSRPSLREALAQMQQDGLLTARSGDGIYVAEALYSAFSPALAALFARHDDAVFDGLAFRRDIEAIAAERAARQASDTDLAVIDAAFQKMQSAHAAGEPAAKLDAQFHMAIIEAGHNVVMLHMMRSMYDLLEGGVFYNRQIMFKRRTTRGAILAQHRTIKEAIAARDPEAARRAVEDHLDFVEAALRADQKAQANEDIARQRLDHETNS